MKVVLIGKVHSVGSITRGSAQVFVSLNGTPFGEGFTDLHAFWIKPSALRGYIPGDVVRVTVEVEFVAPTPDDSCLPAVPK